MRGIVHQFCESRNYSMTGNYKSSTPFGKKTNLEAHHKGEWIIYLLLAASYIVVTQGLPPTSCMVMVKKILSLMQIAPRCKT